MMKTHTPFRRYLLVVAGLVLLAIPRTAHAAITVSGTLYTSAGNETTTVGAAEDGMNVSMDIAGDTTTYTTTLTGSNGTWSFAGVTQPASGTIVTVWMNVGDTTGATNASLVFTYGTSCTGNPNCTGLKMAQTKVIINSKDTGTITNASMAACDNDSGTRCSDTDIGFTSNSGTLTTSWTTSVIRMRDSITFTPGGAVAARTFRQSAGTFTVHSAGMTLYNSLNVTAGTFNNSNTITFSDDGTNPDDSTITYTGAVPGSVVISKTVLTGAQAARSDVTIASTATVALGASPTTAAGSITVNSGCTLTASGTWTFTAGGTSGLVNNGTVTHTGTVWTFNNSSLTNGGAGVMTYSGTAITIENDLTLTTGAGTFNGVNNALSPMTGQTITFSGTDATDDSGINCTGTLGGTVIVSKTGSNVGSTFTVNSPCSISLGASPTTTLSDNAGADFIVASGATVNITSGTWTVSAATADQSVTPAVSNSGTITHTGGSAGWTFNDVELINNSGGVITYGGTAITLDQNFNQSGTFNLSGITVTFVSTSANDDTTITCAATTLPVASTMGGTMVITKTGAFAATVAVASGCSIALGASPTTTLANSGNADFTNNGTIVIASGTWTLQNTTTNGTAGLALINNGTITHIGTGWTFTDVDLINNAAKTITYAGTAITMDRNFTQNGTFDLTGKTVSFIDGNGTDDTTFTCGTNTLPVASTIGGTMVITKTGTVGATITVASGCTISLGASPTTTLANSGNADFTNNGTVVIASGTWTLANSTTGGVAGVDFINNGTLTHSGSGWDLNDIGLTNNSGATITYAGTAITAERTFDQSGTFNLSGKTITFDGSDAVDDSSVSCGATTLPVASTLGGTVVVSKAGAVAATFTVNSPCSMSLGAAPTTTLSNIAAADFTIASGATVVITSGTWTVANATAGGVTGVDIINNGTITHSGSGWDFNDTGLINNSGGVITYAGTTITIEGDLTQNGTFNLSGVTVTFDGTDPADDSTVTCGATTLPSANTLGGTVVVTKTGTGNSFFTVASGCSISLGASPTTTLANDNAADFTNNGTVVIASGTWTVADTATNGATGLALINNGTITHSGTGWDLNDVQLVNSSGATITYAGTAITVERNFDQSGTFNLTGMTVTLDGTDGANDSATLTCGSTLAGNIVINKTNAAALTVLGSDCTIAGSFTRTDGIVSNPGSAYVLTVQGAFSMSMSDLFGGTNMTTKLSGASAQTFTQNAGTITGPMVIDKSASTTVVTMATNMTLGSTLGLTTGVLNQGASFTITTGGTLTVGASGYLYNTGTGDLTLGGDVSNSGTIQLDGTSGGCGDADAIAITSSSGQRAWSGSGNFRMTDVSVTSQGGTAPITATSSTSVSGNGTNWTFSSTCNGVTAGTASTATGNNVSSLPWSHTSPSGSDALLMVGVALRTTTSTVTSVTFGAQSLTKVSGGSANNGTDARVEMWYLLAPTASTNTVTVTLSAASNVTAGALTFTGVNQSAPLQTFTTATGSSAAPSVTITGSATTSMVYDVMAMQGTKTVSAPTTSWTNVTSDGTNANNVRGAGTSATGAETVTMGYTMSGSDKWVIGAVAIQGAPPTAARLLSFGAEQRLGGVALTWRTGFEADNLGFHVLREQAGQRVRVSPSLIAGSALFAGVGATLVNGRSYGWFDAPGQDGAASGSRYWLEEVDLAGQSTFHGPVIPAAASAFSDVPRQSALLADLGQERPAAVAGPEGRQRRASWREPPRTNQAVDIQTGPWVKIKVRKEGWYRVGLSELQAAGLSGPPRLFADGQEQAILTVNDGIEFYGMGADTPWTDERTYVVSQSVSGAAKTVVRKSAAGNVAAAASFPFTIERRDRSIYFAALINGDADNFFGPVLAKSPVELALTVDDLDPGSPVTLEVALQGVTPTPHRVDVALNGTRLGVVTFQGRAPGVLAVNVPAGVLVEGANKVGLAPSGQGMDTTLVDFVRVTYPRRYRARNNLLRFSLPRGQAVTVRGFTRADLRAVDVTDAAAPIELGGTVTQGQDGYELTLFSNDGAKEVLAFGGDGVQRPASLVGRPAGAIAGGPVDFVILSPRAFASALAPLVARRQADGFAVQLVDLEDVYDTFGYGQKSPFAMRNFLAEARGRGARFALLVGDASLDPRNFLGLGSFDLTPTKIVPTAFGETASDDWLADFDDDGLPDLAVGRLPVRTEEEARAVVQKLVDHQTPVRPSPVLLLSGKRSDMGFAAGAETLLAGLPPGIARHVRADTLGADGARRELISFLEGESGIVEYVGHGSVELWADGLLDRSDAKSFGTWRPSVFVPLTCLNGFFHDVYTESLAETLLKTPGGGALAVWASSGLTDSGEQLPLGKEFLRRLINEGLTLGEAARAAKALAGSDVRRTWILFGDPTMRMAPVSLAAPDSGVAGPDSARGAPDAGASGTDSSTGGAGAIPASSGGCACNVGGEGTGTPPLPICLSAGLLVGLLAWRRRRSVRHRGGLDGG